MSLRPGRGGWLLVAVWLVSSVGTILTRPLAPIDETRYVAVAWEMWNSGQAWVPLLNGLPYSDKPPLLFWLIEAGWSAFGVNAVWPRLISPLLGLVSLLLTVGLARRLWPADRGTAGRSMWILLGALLFGVMTSLVMTDNLLVVTTLVALTGLLVAAEGRSSPGWLIVGLALGAGILSKGPVAWLHVLPVALLAPWWIPARRVQSWKHWYLGLVGALSLSVTVALLWVVPAVWAGGWDYTHDLLWRQTSGRLVASFAHSRPAWWYLAMLPAILFPWAFWPPAWRSIARTVRAGLEPPVRFCLSWALPPLVLLSLISGKQPHYLLPLVPAFALIVGRGLSASRRPVRVREQLPWAVAVMAVGVALIAVATVRLPQLLVPGWVLGASVAAGVAIVALGVILPLLPETAALPEAARPAVATVATLLILQIGFAQGTRSFLDVDGVARRLSELQREGVPLAFVGNYEGQFEFAGRLERPIESLGLDEIAGWARRHPDGRIVLERHKGWRPEHGIPEDLPSYRGHRVMLWRADSVRAEGTRDGETFALFSGRDATDDRRHSRDTGG